MKLYHFLILISVFTLYNCSSSRYNLAPTKEVTQKYRTYLEPGEEELSVTYTKLYSKNSANKYIERSFYPQKAQLTAEVEYKTKQFKIKNGPSKYWYDDGSLAKEGEYKENLPHGHWKYYHFGLNSVSQEGIYKNGKRFGVWRTFNESGKLISEYQYSEGRLSGNYMVYDSTTNVIASGVYKDGKHLKELSKNTEMIKTLPLMYVCSKVDLNPGETLEGCSNRKMLTFIYRNIRYPNQAKAKRIQGTALLRFNINTMGTISDVEVLSGLCNSIAKECKRVVSLMPAWEKPGMQNGSPIKSSYILPINFRLQ